MDYKLHEQLRQVVNLCSANDSEDRVAGSFYRAHDAQGAKITPANAVKDTELNLSVCHEQRRSAPGRACRSWPFCCHTASFGTPFVASGP